MSGTLVRWPMPRALASLAPDRPAVIEASAGTGKTYTLEHLVVDLLLRGDVPIESILVVTYTERAASELRARIRAKLVELAHARPKADDEEAALEDAPVWTLDDQARAKLVRALHSFDLASISTIHAFCQSTLVDNAFLGRRLFDQALVDGKIAFSRAFVVALRRVLARDPGYRPYLEAWLARSSLEAAEKLLSSTLARRGVFRPSFEPARLTALLFELKEALPEPARVRAGLDSARVRKQSIDAVLERHAALKAHLAEFGGEPDLPRFIAAIEDEESRRPFFSFLAERLAECRLDRKVVTFQRLVAEVGQLCPSLPAAFAERLLPPVVEELARAKSRRGELDFDDMLSLLLGALEGPRGRELEAAIARRYTVALVDEFQDTDDVQWRIFQRVFLDHTPPRPLFVIGDPKQAIYGFRGADVHTYLAATADIRARGGAHVSLTESFRSTPALIEGLNAILDQTVPEPFFPGAIRYDAPVRAARVESPDDLEGPPIRLLTVVSGERELSGPRLREVLGTFIAEEAARLIAQGEVEPSEIFVLTRTTRESIEVGAHLRRAGVPHAFYKQEGLFQTREAVEINTLLTAVLDPEHTSRRVRAWTGPFFEVPLEALPACLDLPATDPLHARLYAWNAIAAKKDYGRLFNAILEESGVLRRLLFFEEGERELTNYLHIFEVLLEEANQGSATLEELVHTLTAFIEGKRTPEGDSGNVQRLESERSAVQIMTEHKAKGLEARAVFLYGGFGAAKADVVRVVHQDGERVLAFGDAHKDAVRREQEEEDRRLLYVAITRAEERLYLPYVPKSQTLSGSYQPLNAALDRIVSGLRAGDARLERLFLEQTLEAREEEDAVSGRAAPASLEQFAPTPQLLEEVEPSAALTRLTRTRFGHLVTSYSRLKSAAGGYHPPEKPEALGEDADADPELAVSRDATMEREALRLPGGSGSGRFLHEVLEKVSVESFDGGSFAFWRQHAEVKAIFEEARRRYDIAPEHIPHAEELVYVALAAPIEARGLSLPRGIVATDQLLREMEFLYPIPESSHPTLSEGMTQERLSVERGFIKGFIDLIFEHEGRLYVVDWKSDHLPSYGASALEVHCAHNYALQADLYTLAVVKMLGIRSHAEYERAFGGTLYCFVRGMSLERAGEGVRFARARWSDVVEIERRLREGHVAEEGGRG